MVAKLARTACRLILTSFTDVLVAPVGTLTPATPAPSGLPASQPTNVESSLQVVNGVMAHSKEKDIREEVGGRAWGEGGREGRGLWMWVFP